MTPISHLSPGLKLRLETELYLGFVHRDHMADNAGSPREDGGTRVRLSIARSDARTGRSGFGASFLFPLALAEVG